MVCKNCENTFEGNFCNECGQHARVRRIDFRYIIDELPNSIFQLNRGFLFTVKELFTRPGHSIREFIEGRRQPYYKPIAFVLLASVLYVLTTYLLDKNTAMADFMSGFFEKASDPTAIKYGDWIEKNQTYISLIFIPFFSLATYFAFVRSKYNYFEHFILNTYITGQQLIIYTIFSFLISQDNFLLLIPIVLGVAFNFWTLIQFFQDKKFIAKFSLVILSYVILIIQFVLMSLVAIGISKLFE